MRTRIASLAALLALLLSMPRATASRRVACPTPENIRWSVSWSSTSYNPNCTGVGGAYRLDQPDDLEFLADHGITP